MLEMLCSSSQNIQGMCLKMEKRIASLETEVSAINVKLTTSPPPALPGLSTSVDDAALAALRSDIRKIEEASQKHQESVVKVTKSINDNQEKRLKLEISTLSSQTAAHLAHLETAVEKVRARDVSLGKRISKLIKVNSVLKIQMYVMYVCLFVAIQAVCILTIVFCKSVILD